MKYRFTIHRRVDDDKFAFVGPSDGDKPILPEGNIFLWLHGFERKPLYAINVTLKEQTRGSRAEEGC